LTLSDGAIEPWTKPQYDWAKTELRSFCKSDRIPMNVPFNQLTRPQQRAIVNGKGEWSGVRGFFDWLETKKYKLHVRVFMSKYRGYTLCPDCEGGRLRQEARDVRVGGQTLPEVSALSIKDAAVFFDALELLPEQSADPLVLSAALKQLMQRAPPSQSGEENMRLEGLVHISRIVGDWLDDRESYPPLSVVAE